ncbi:peptidoglycan-binding domain-containing protein [Methanolobus sp. ZRKC3]|uniref:peptidoglycan-binding domain-containing protein n=1 Tax=Methanolobus sp. ZRKC3 TaxID=3125786 RepID=UPI0032533E43
MYLNISSKGDLVKEVQSKLKELGFDPGVIDGNYEQKTRDAVVQFQESKALKIDGIVGPVSLKVLGIKMRPVEPEAARESFKLLLLANPNYFGNLSESTFKPVKSMCSNTHYEELVCLGYHPQQKQLEAAVHVYQPSGYGTDICGPGTPEFVRFYLSFDNGVTWQDQGMTSFQAHNIPEGTKGEKRLEYAASLPIDPQAKVCWFDPLVKVRAILSWNDTPLPNQPNWKPVWGNVRETTILIEPLRLIPFPIFFKAIKADLPFPIEKVVDLDNPLPTKVKSLEVAELAEIYKDKGVSVHRFAYKEMMAFASGQTIASAQSLATLPKEIGINPDIIEQLKPLTDGDTSYEELTCIGLDPNTPDTMVGVIQVKKPYGYSGDPCSDGSREYVTFWADFDGNGTFETCLGTADVQVYDVKVIPPEGIQYAVRLPVDLTPYRQVCKKGPKVVRIRAILSWNMPVPCGNPNTMPRWGNREETLINIGPVASEPAGKIAILGGIPVGHIHDVTGLTTATAVFATNNKQPDKYGRACSFAGRVTVQGLSVPNWSYMVEVSQDAVIWTPVVTDLKVTDQNGITNDHKANPVTKRFAYLPFNQNVNSLLAQWDTTGDAKWYVRLTTYDAGGVEQGSDTHLIQLDNTWPDASITITTGPGSCGKFPVGTLLEGKFVARDVVAGDDYLRDYSVYVLPNVNPAGVGIPVPNSGLASTAAAPGDDWDLDTTGMTPCGYTIHVRAVDRAIRNSQWVGHRRYASAGFCLELPKKEEEK